MGFVEAVRLCLQRYATFEGRSARPEFWWWVLFSFLFNIVVGGLFTAIGLDWLGSLVGLALLLPGLAVGARRLHDTGRSGWWQAAVYVPALFAVAAPFLIVIASVAMIAMAILLIVWLASPGDAGPNGYGPPPSLA